MATTLADLRAALAARIEAGAGLKCYPSWPDTFEPPGAILKRVAGPRRFTHGAIYTVTFEITVGVPVGESYEAAQARLDPYTEPGSTSSIAAALEADKTLGGVAEGIAVDDWGKDQSASIGGAECVMNTLNVEVRYRAS